MIHIKHIKKITQIKINRKTTLLQKQKQNKTKTKTKTKTKQNKTKQNKNKTKRKQKQKQKSFQLQITCTRKVEFSSWLQYCAVATKIKLQVELFQLFFSCFTCYLNIQYKSKLPINVIGLKFVTTWWILNQKSLSMRLFGRKFKPILHTRCILRIF